MATRKRVILTLYSNVKVIRQHEKGIGSRQLAAEFGVGKSQIRNIVTAKADGYLEAVGLRCERAVRKYPYADLKTKVFDWFCSARASNFPLGQCVSRDKFVFLFILIQS